MAINDEAYDADALKDTLKADAKTGNTDTIKVLVKAGSHYKTVTFDYHNGLRYPKLVRVDGTPDLWSDIIAEKK